ncbi:MAG: class I SAM-dependent methyltransferase [Candidatus Zixiibacteriota bacterium]
MPKTGPFERYTKRYEEWFEKNRVIYRSELRAVRELLPQVGVGIEIGVGTGRFATPLGIQFGVDPSRNMARVAAKRGIQVIGGQAEALPLRSGNFDFALMVTTICFLDDVSMALQEANRILKPGGALIVGFIDRQSFLGRQYEQNGAQNPFYKEATFYAVDEVRILMEKAGFGDFTFRQTIFRRREDLRMEEPVEDGFGQGAFVVVKGYKM